MAFAEVAVKVDIVTVTSEAPLAEYFFEATSLDIFSDLIAMALMVWPSVRVTGAVYSVSADVGSAGESPAV